jgi:hypothetical protein
MLAQSQESIAVVGVEAEAPFFVFLLHSGVLTHSMVNKSS